MTDTETIGTMTSTPIQVVQRLLDALVDFDQHALEATLADDVAYTNVSFPTIHGRRAVGRSLAKFFGGLGATFEVSEGKVTVWRDYFDYYDLTRATARALAGAVVPSLRPRFPDAGSAVTKTR
jgi:limonene-1,2-epoxide hydrolase